MFLYKCLNGFLFGTFHMGLDWRKFPPSLFEMAKTAPRVILEVDVMAIQGEVIPPLNLSAESCSRLAGFFENDFSKESTVVDLLRGLFSKICREFNLDLSPYCHAPLDFLLGEIAQDRGYLETPKFQVDLLTRIFDDEAVSDIIDAWDKDKTKIQEGGGSEFLAKTVELYVAGDPALMDHLGLITPGGEKYLTMVNDERNQKWGNKVEMELEEGSFIAVGCFHLISPEGSLIDVLRKRGHMVERVILDEPSVMDLYPEGGEVA